MAAINNDLTGLHNNTMSRKRKVVHQYSLEGKFIKSFHSVSVAATELLVGHSKIADAARLKESAKGFYWSYEEQDNIDLSQFKNVTQQPASQKKPVQKLTMDGKPVEIYHSTYAAGKAMKIPSNRISTACKRGITCKGFRWQHVKSESDI